MANCRFIGEFDQLDILGEGTYGTVYRAKDKRNNEEVAIKKMKVHDTQCIAVYRVEGFPITSLREVKVLKKLANHPNIIALKDVVVGKAKDSVFLVFEYCQIDLVNLIDQMLVERLKFHENEVKCLTLQIMKGVTYLLAAAHIPPQPLHHPPRPQAQQPAAQR